MFSQIPLSLNKVKPADLDKEILRAAIVGELDAVNLYEQMASLTDNAHLRAVLLDVANEEKIHIGEFQAMLLRLDPNKKNFWPTAPKKWKNSWARPDLRPLPKFLGEGARNQRTLPPLPNHSPNPLRVVNFV